MKTKKTLAKRVKITGSGKLLKNQSDTGHLKVKWSANKKTRKNKRLVQHNKGHIKIIKKLLGKYGKGLRHA